MLDEELCQRVERYLENQGFKLKMGRKVIALKGKGSVTSVQLDSGERVDSEMVFMNVGSTPNLDLARDMGLEIGRYGIKIAPERLSHIQPTVLQPVFRSKPQDHGMLQGWIFRSQNV